MSGSSTVYIHDHRYMSEAEIRMNPGYFQLMSRIQPATIADFVRCQGSKFLKSPSWNMNHVKAFKCLFFDDVSVNRLIPPEYFPGDKDPTMRAVRNELVGVAEHTLLKGNLPLGISYSFFRQLAAVTRRPWDLYDSRIYLRDEADTLRNVDPATANEDDLTARLTSQMAVTFLDLLAAMEQSAVPKFRRVSDSFWFRPPPLLIDIVASTS
jgi:hypothetical protein